MAATIPSLWPDDIKADIFPPVAILRIQAVKIREITNGILHADVTTTTGADDFVIHRLELVAPALENRRYGVLTATHRGDFYPVVLEADCYRPGQATVQDVRQAVTAQLGAKLLGYDPQAKVPLRPWPYPTDWRPVVANQDEFLKRVAEVFRSMEVRSVIESMIALSNQKTEDAEQEAEAAPTA